MTILAASTFRLLRVTSSLSDDTDWVTAQTAIASIPYKTACDPHSAQYGLALKLEIVCEWLDAAGAVVSPGTNTFDATPILIGARESVSPSLLSGNAVIDGATMTGLETHKAYLLQSELMSGDRFTVRFTNMTRGGAAALRCLYREVR